MSMCIYYRELQLVNEMCCIYSSFLNDYHRYIISRWRLSCHSLKIETGRYTRPKTPRINRVCELCDLLEDERHVIYACPRYVSIREKYLHLITSTNVSSFLNPKYDTMIDTANFLHEIEKIRNGLKSVIVT